VAPQGKIHRAISDQVSQNPQSATQATIRNFNPQSALSIHNRQSKNPQSSIRNQHSAVSQSGNLERCIRVSTSQLVATYPSTYPAPEATEALTPTVSSLFELHAPGLYRLALAMLHDPAAAQDVVQDTVAAHACRDRQRRSGRWLPWIRERDTRSALETPDRFDDREALLDAIRVLSSRDRLLVALRAQGLSYQEIGDAAGIRHTSVGRLLTRALNRLQKELNRATETQGRTRPTEGQRRG
jgi:DNA-directed RNA polymerase specialized sigma24 family protein